jgi:ribose 5-phosphate isomerase A
VSTDELKREAGERAVADEVRSGMRVGLGSGSTAMLMLEALAARVADGRLGGIAGVPTSKATGIRARELGITLTDLATEPVLDVVIDGADEIDPELRLIKGLGGAFLREKVVAAAGRRMVVVADESKLVARLGERAPLPVEVVEFALPVCARMLRGLGWETVRREAAGGGPFVTDEGNAILDCRRADWSDPAALAAGVRAVPGVVEHGFFLGIAGAAVVGTADGVRVLERASPPAAAP